MVPVFSTSMQRSSHPAPRPPPVQNSLPTSSSDTFFSRIQKTSDDREQVHCSRLSRVKHALQGREVQASSGAQAKTDLLSILPLFSETLSTPGTGPHTPPAVVGSFNTKNMAVGSRRNTPSASASSVGGPSHPRTSTAGPICPPIIQQYQNAVYHHTEASTTSVVRISCEDHSKEINLTNNFVKSELLSAPVYFPHDQPSQYSNSLINKSPNKKHRGIIIQNDREKL